MAADLASLVPSPTRRAAAGDTRLIRRSSRAGAVLTLTVDPYDGSGSTAWTARGVDLGRTPKARLIDATLTEDLTAPRKRRHTARRVLARVADEHELTELTHSAVRDDVARRRPEIEAAAGTSRQDAFVPQPHEPGAEGEVDLADLWIDRAGAARRSPSSATRSGCVVLAPGSARAHHPDHGRA